jgi:metal-sulfur cluster biosynthetic enzyme
MTPASTSLAERARLILHDVVDPELGLDIVDLGLVYAVRQDGDGLVVEMTLTTPGCPVSEALPAEASAALEAGLGVPVQVVVVWDPPWTPDRIDPAAAEVLGLRR